jgi:hypothetical protein
MRLSRRAVENEAIGFFDLKSVGEKRSGALVANQIGEQWQAAAPSRRGGARMRQNDTKPPQIFQSDEPLGPRKTWQFDRDHSLKCKKLVAREAEQFIQ